jgi:hypothetical protein
MKIARINDSVLKVVRLEKDAHGNPAPVVLYKKKSKRKKMTSGLRPLEKLVRRVAKAESTYADAYVQKHNRSNEKRRDGWLVDLIPNLARAENKGEKKLRLIRAITG